MGDSLHDGKRHHDYQDQNSSIPHGYNDLTHTEIELLTQILSHAPRRKPSTSAYEQVVRGLISELPARLRSKLPWLSSFCSLHKRMNPLPVTSILEWLKGEIEDVLPSIWKPLRKRQVLDAGQSGMLVALEDLSALWRPPESFMRKFGRAQQTDPPYDFHSNGCAACILAQIGGNIRALTALGGFFIGRVETTVWKRSVRIIWMEAWIRDTTEANLEEDAIRSMWKLGVQLRELRIKSAGSARSYVDEYIKQALSAENADSAPSSGTPSVSELSELTANDGTLGLQTLSVNERLAEATADDIFSDMNEVTESDPMLQESDPQEHFQGPASVVRAQETTPSLRVPSSLYSHNSDGSPWSARSSYDSESVLIGHYRHSRWSKATSLVSESRDRRSSAAPSPLSQQAKDPELANYPRHKMDPITLPRRRYG